MLDKITAFCAYAFIACLVAGFVLFIFELVDDKEERRARKHDRREYERNNFYE